MRFGTGLVSAGLGPEIFWVVFAFFAAMTVFTAQSILAAILVVNYRPLGVPLLARYVWIYDLIGLATKILPVVSVDAGRSLVAFISLCVGAPYCLVVKHIKVSVFFKFFYQVDRDLCLRVREWAVFSVFANRILFSETRAKLCLIFIWVIKLFDPVVAIGAIFPLWATFLFSDKGAKFGFVVAKFASSVFGLVMVVWASF